MRTFIALALFVTVIHSATAEHRHRSDRNTPRTDKEQRKELRLWLAKEVLPTLQQWQREYDASLESEDLQVLQRLRSEAKAERERFRSAIKNRETDTTVNTEIPVKHQQKFKQHRRELKQIFKQAEDIVRRSKPVLEKLFADNRTTIERWVEKAQSFNSRLPIVGKDGNIKNKNVIRFILWDGSIPAHRTVPENEGHFGADDNNSTSPSQVTVSPNPASQQIRIQMDRCPAQQVLVRLLTMDGALVKKQAMMTLNSTLDATMDIADLTDGTYIISIQTPTWQKSAPFVLRR